MTHLHLPEEANMTPKGVVSAWARIRALLLPLLAMLS